jgi:hypothetical protein
MGMVNDNRHDSPHRRTAQLSVTALGGPWHVDHDLGFFGLLSMQWGEIPFFPKMTGLHDEVSTDHD